MIEIPKGDRRVGERDIESEPASVEKGGSGGEGLNEVNFGSTEELNARLKPLFSELFSKDGKIRNGIIYARNDIVNALTAHPLTETAVVPTINEGLIDSEQQGLLTPAEYTTLAGKMPELITLAIPDDEQRQRVIKTLK